MDIKRHKKYWSRATPNSPARMLIPRFFRVLRIHIDRRFGRLSKRIAQTLVLSVFFDRMNSKAKPISFISLHIREQLMPPIQDFVAVILQQIAKWTKGYVEDTFCGLVIKLYQALIMLLAVALPHSELSTTVLILSMILAFVCMPFLQFVCRILSGAEVVVDATRFALKHAHKTPHKKYSHKLDTTKPERGEQQWNQ